MQEVSAPVVAIAFILAAVFIPVAFIGGISGQIYKQFALTIAASVLLSAFSALSLSPGAERHDPASQDAEPGLAGPFLRRRSIAASSGPEAATCRAWAGLIRKSALALAGSGSASGWRRACCSGTCPAASCRTKTRAPSSLTVRLPDGASVERADAATRKVENIVRDLPGVEQFFTLGGLDMTTRTSGSNVATVIVRLKPWDERSTPDLQLRRDSGAPAGIVCRVPEAVMIAFAPPPILGLSTTGGFQFMLEDRAGGSVQDLAQAADLLVQAARSRPELANVVNTFRPNVPAYKVDVDVAKVQTLGIPVTDAYDALQTFLGGLYVNDFNAFGRTWQVLVQAEPEFRTQPADINRFYVRNGDGNMVPLGTLSSVKRHRGARCDLPLQPVPRDPDAGRTRARV